MAGPPEASSGDSSVPDGDSPGSKSAKGDELKSSSPEHAPVHGNGEETGNGNGNGTATAGEYEDEEKLGQAVDSEDSEKVTKKDKDKKKKKKKKKKGANHGERPTMPTQAVVDLVFPWKAVNKANAGRAAIASRDIKAGEIVVAEQAVAFTPRSQDRSLMCHCCCKDVSYPMPSIECGECHYSVFCPDCNVKAMVHHKQWCPVVSKISTIAKESDCEEDLLYFVLALAAQRESAANATDGEDGISKKGTVNDGIILPTYEDAICLETHSEKVVQGWKVSVKKGCNLLYDEIVKQMTPNEPNFSVDDLELIAALVNTNAHGMGAHGSGIHNTDIAVGVFPFVSMLNHSCRPNCCFASDGRVMYVRATQDIPKNTELCLSYINLYEPRSTRKMQLAATKHFLCRCDRCSEPFSSSVDRFLEGCLCSVKNCGGVTVRSSSLHEKDGVQPGSMTSWECDTCARVLDPDSASTTKSGGPLVDKPWVVVARAEQKLAAAIKIYKERRFKDARVALEQYVDEFTGKLHPLNVLLFDSLTPLMNCCRALGDAALGTRTCRCILDSMEKALPGVSLELSNFCFCLGEMYLERCEASTSTMWVKRYRKLAQETFQRVREIRQICLGSPSLPNGQA